MLAKRERKEKGKTIIISHAMLTNYRTHYRYGLDEEDILGAMRV